MNIGLVTLDIKPGGAQRLVLEEARHFEERGHDVTLIPITDDKEFRTSIGVDEVRVREFPSIQDRSFPVINRPFEISRLRSILLEENLDLIISHYHDTDVYLATRMTDMRYSCHINGSPFWFSFEGPISAYRNKSGYEAVINAVAGHSEFVALDDYPTHKRLYQLGRERLRARALQESTVVTTLTDRVASELDFCYGVEPEVIRPGVGEEWFEMDIEASPQDLPGVTTDHAICNIGRLDERKRNALLIRAFAGIAKDRDDVTLIIGGTGSEGDTLQALASDLDIAESVVFPGYIPEEELPEYYAASDILAHPAWVAYGLVPLEAYVLGTKVAISTDTLVKEVIAGEPGVEVIAPSVSEWEVKLRELLSASNHIPNKSAVPTWTQYFENKYDVMINNGVF